MTEFIPERGLTSESRRAHALSSWGRSVTSWQVADISWAIPLSIHRWAVAAAKLVRRIQFRQSAEEQRPPAAIAGPSDRCCTKTPGQPQQGNPIALIEGGRRRKKQLIVRKLLLGFEVMLTLSVDLKNNVFFWNDKMSQTQAKTYNLLCMKKVFFNSKKKILSCGFR